MQHGPATFGDRITAVLEGKYYRSERTGKSADTAEATA